MGVNEKGRSKEEHAGPSTVERPGAGAGGALADSRGERVEAAVLELARALKVGAEGERPRRRRRADAGQVRLTARDLEALTWIGQQYAIFQPQLERLLGAQTSIAYRTRTRWVRAKWATGAMIRADQPPVVWLTSEGLRMCDLEFPAWRPSAATLAHVYAVNQVRLAVAAARPEWAWTSERELARDQPRAASGARLGHRPDALVTTDQGERIPIEVELTQKTAARIETTIRETLKVSEQLWYFAPPAPAGAIRRVADRLGLGDRVTIDAIP